MKTLFYFFVKLVLASSLARAEENVTEYLRIPDKMILGVSTASYQIEGGWNASDKSPSVWDRFTHETPSPIADGSNGDVACDSYNKYNADLELLSDLGVKAYRMSLSWARILPNGFANEVSTDGIRYYRNILENLTARGIEPFVTIYHWDHPVILEEMGGWTNEMMVEWFVDYARVVFEHFGDIVKSFSTLNEPVDMCEQAYGTGEKAPGKKIRGVGPYLCMHNMLKAHGRVYRMYENEYRDKHKGIIGIVMQCMSYYPKYEDDTKAAEIHFDFRCGFMTEPIFSKEGDYPEVMKRRIGENSKLEGYPRSRLPSFTEEEIEMIRGSADFLGLNHYTSLLTESVPKPDHAPWYQDSGTVRSYDPQWPSTVSSWLKIVPKGLGDLLRKLRDRYDNPVVYVMENGVADNGTDLDDYFRVKFLQAYIQEMLIAVNRDKCNVAGYLVWSFLDNFEWQSGYAEHFGLVHVDFQDPNRTRTPKLSYFWYQELLRTRKLPGLPRK